MNQNTTVTTEIDAEYLWGDSFTEWLESREYEAFKVWFQENWL